MGCKVPAQLLVCEKLLALTPVISISVIVSGVLPVLVRITGFELLVRVDTSPKAKLVGEALIPGAPATPVPVSGIKSVPPGMLLAFV